MNKITIVAKPGHGLDNSWMEPLYQDYVVIVPYDPELLNNAKNTIFYVNTLDNNEYYVDMLLSRNLPVLIDSNSEMPTRFMASKYINNDLVYIMASPNWFWYNESMMQYRRGDHNFVPEPNYSKLALMPINLARPHRIDLINSLKPQLEDFIWSLAGEGRFLPGGGNPFTEWHHQRTFVPQWYNDTCFSLVVETEVHANDYIFITEKTFKPMAYRHPLLVWGQPGTLARLHELGFETFENLFDESYDTTLDNDDRMDIILKNVAEYQKIPYSKLTLDKIQHNHHLYFDQELIKRRVIDEIIIPLVEYVNKT